MLPAWFVKKGELALHNDRSCLYELPRQCWITKLRPRTMASCGRVAEHRKTGPKAFHRRRRRENSACRPALRRTRLGRTRWWPRHTVSLRNWEPLQGCVMLWSTIVVMHTAPHLLRLPLPVSGFSMTLRSECSTTKNSERCNEYPSGTAMAKPLWICMLVSAYSLILG